MTIVTNIITAAITAITIWILLKLDLFVFHRLRSYPIRETSIDKAIAAIPT
jgi:hypothetical protein